MSLLDPRLNLLTLLSPPWAGPAVPTLLASVAAISLGYGLWVMQGSGECRKSAATLSFLTAVGLVAWLTAVYAVAWCGLAIGAWHGPTSLVIATILTLLLCFLVLQGGGVTRRQFVLSQLMCISVVVGMVLISGAFYDLSYDGQAYHQEAVVQISNGWNPLRQPDATVGTSRLYEFSNRLWIEHYPKASWIIGAAIVSATTRIETGKAPALVLIVASFLATMAAIAWSARVPHWLAPIVTTALALNPVVVTQALTFYVDGLLGSLMLALLASVAMAVMRRELRGASFLLILCCLCLMIGLKFTGALYAVAFLLAVGPLLWWATPQSRRVVGVTAAFLALLVSFAVLGFNPYVTNTRAHGSPFYPVQGERAVDVMKGMVSDGFLAAPPLARLAKSLVSESSVVAPVPKLPMVVRRDEVLSFFRPDVNFGGFGPLFSAMIIVALLCLPLLALRFRVLKKCAVASLTWAAAVLLGSVVLMPEAWWARLAPQLWLVITVTLSAVFVLFGPGSCGLQPRIARGIAGFGLTLALANIALVGVASIDHQVTASEQLATDLATLRDVGAIRADTSGLASGGRMLDEAGVHATIVRLTEAESLGLDSTFIRVSASGRE